MDASIKKRIQSIATDVVVKEIAFGTNDYLLSKSFFNVNILYMCLSEILT